MAVSTRYVALPYHFQLDEHGVGAGLVENLNTMCEMEKGERKKGMHEKSGREGEWVVKKKNTRGKRERQRKRGGKCRLYLPDQFHLS